MLMCLALLLGIGISHASVRIQDNLGNNINTISRDITTNRTININFSVCAIGENISLVKLFHFGVWNIAFSESSITNLTENTCHQLFADVTVPLLTQSGNYSERIMFLSLTDIEQLDIQINVLESTVWAISPTNTTIQVKRGDWGKIYDLTVTNNGNVDVTFTTNLINSNNLVWFDTSAFRLLPFSQLARPVYYYINQTLIPAVYPINISIVDTSGNVKSSLLNFNVTDDRLPVIDSVELAQTEVKMGEAVLFYLTAHDDRAIEWVGIAIKGDVYNFTVVNQTSYKFVWNKTNAPEIVNYTLFVSDGINVATQTGLFEVKKKQAIFVLDTVAFGKVKYLQTRFLKLGEIQQSGTYYEFKLRMIDVSNPNITVNIYVNDKLLKENSTLVFADPMVLFIKVEEIGYENATIPYDYYVTYNGVIDTETAADTDNPAPMIKFRGSFGEYTVTPSQYVGIPVISNGAVITKYMYCNPNDIGYFDNSTYDCTISYPIDIGSDNLPVITSVTAYQNLKEGYERNATTIAMQRDAAEAWRNGLLILVIAGTIIILFYWFIWRFWHRH